MKYISKDASPIHFEDWKIAFKRKYHRNANYNDFSCHEHIDEKNAVKQDLINEQKGLCCYCCSSLTLENSHIEHFRPKSIPKYDNLSMAYNNLHASCQGSGNRFHNCGHKKKKWFDEILTVSPLELDCEALFAYTNRGKIRAKEDNIRASETIKHLNLDSDMLNAARETALWTAGVFEEYDQEIRDDLVELFRTHKDGKLEPFCNIIVYGFLNF